MGAKMEFLLVGFGTLLRIFWVIVEKFQYICTAFCDLSYPNRAVESLCY